MIAPNDVNGRAQAIRGLIAEDRVLDSIPLLMDFVRDFSESREHKTDVILISRSLKSVSKREANGELEFATAERERMQRLRQALILVDEVEERAKVPALV